jgi:hypothetical protein
MGNCFSKICYNPRTAPKPILEIPKIHKEEITIEYIPLINHYKT